MTKAEWISMVKWRLPQIDKTKKYDDRLIERYLNMFRNKYIHDAIQKVTSYASFYSKEYPSQVVTLNGNTNQYFTLLPATIVQLPYTQEGIIKIQSNQATDLEYVPIDEQDLEYMDEHYSLSYRSDTITPLDGVISFVLKEDRVLYDKNMTATIAAAGVKITMIQDFVSYSSADTVIMPEGRDSDIITETVNFMLGIPPRDLTLSNSDG